MNTAVLGLGLLGSEIALRLHRQGLPVTCWNRGEERARAARLRGLQVVTQAAGAIAAAELVILVLSDAAAIETTLSEPQTAAALDGRILVQMGTIAPDESRMLADRAARRGARYLEMPVLGSLPEAREGRLIAMAAGERDLFEHCLPVLRALSHEPRYLGPVGQGAAMKLAMNQLIAGLTASFSLSLELVRREGLDVGQFMELLRGSALHAGTFDKKLARYLSHDYDQANFPLTHLLKDIRLFQQVAAGHDMDTRLSAAIASAGEQAVDMGWGNRDYSVLYEALADGRCGNPAP